MLSASDLHHDGYPLRPASAHGSRLHSEYLSATYRRRLKRSFARQAARPSTGELAVEMARLRRLYPERVAREFAQFARALDVHQQGLAVDRRHIDAAYGLLHRRVELMPQRIDRVIAAGMAALVLVRLGAGVHLVVDGPAAIGYARKWLLPVFERLGITVGVIDTGADERARRAAYRESVTLVSARECAMDFLRDAHNWPQRGDASMRLVDGLLGHASRQQATLMRGLPCAILLDIDSALVDNARTPIVLTRDAHPMHEAEELDKAMAMVEYLETPAHYRLTGTGQEVEFTPAGDAMIAQWSERLGGIWSVSHVARQLVSVAVVVVHVLERDNHYRLADRSIEWLVPDELVPGLTHYSRAFLSRMLEVREQVPASVHREVIGRASYQQIFNRYVHLCGLAHSLDGIAAELRAIYGLKCRGRRRAKRTPYLDKAVLVRDAQAQASWLSDAVAQRDARCCFMVVVNSTQRLESLAQAVTDLGIEAAVIDEPADVPFEALFAPGAVLLVLAPIMDCLLPIGGQSVSCPLDIVVAQRSIRVSEDRRNMFLMTARCFPRRRTVLLLSLDDELFEGVSLWGLSKAQRLLGRRLTAIAVEWRIRRLQARRAGEFSRVRRDLLHYDTSMQGLLSISGRGLYE